MNLHQKYQTKNHHHLDWLISDRSGELVYPASALMLAEAGDGRWFIQQEFGDEYDRIPGIAKDAEDIDAELVFYAGVEECVWAAFDLMKKVHPHGISEDSVHDFLSDEE
jgi:hypothetical protein